MRGVKEGVWRAREGGGQRGVYITHSSPFHFLFFPFLSFPSPSPIPFSPNPPIQKTPREKPCTFVKTSFLITLCPKIVIYTVLSPLLSPPELGSIDVFHRPTPPLKFIYTRNVNVKTPSANDAGPPPTRVMPTEMPPYQMRWFPFPFEGLPVVNAPKKLGIFFGGSERTIFPQLPSPIVPDPPAAHSPSVSPHRGLHPPRSSNSSKVPPSPRKFPVLAPTAGSINLPFYLQQH